MSKIYLSLPISGYDYSERKQLSLKIQNDLEKKGYEVYNPMFNGLPKDASTHEHMRVDFKMLCECDEIIMFPKWNHSAGCTQEFNVAVAIGCNVKILVSIEPMIMIDFRFD